MKRILLVIVSFVFLVGCNNATSEEEDKEAIGDDRFVRFQYLEVISEDTTVVMTGDVATSEGELYYTIAQGEEVLIEEQTLPIEQTGEEWVGFEVREELASDVEKTSDTPPIIAIYGKTEKGTEINPNYIPVDLNMVTE